MSKVHARRDFDRRAFLRRAAAAGGVAWAVPVIISLDASPAFATPAPDAEPVPPGVVPVGPTPKTYPDQGTQVGPAYTVANPPTDASGNSIWPGNNAFLKRGSYNWGLRHIISPQFRNGQPYRVAHPWTSLDVAATRACLSDLSALPVPEPERPNNIVYTCCRSDPVKGQCCRIVTIDRARCSIISSYDDCDNSLVP